MINQDNQKEPTPEEIEAYKAKMTAFYDKELPFLRLHAEYIRLNSEIHQNRLKEYLAINQLASVTAPQGEKK